MEHLQKTDLRFSDAYEKPSALPLEIAIVNKDLSLLRKIISWQNQNFEFALATVDKANRNKNIFHIIAAYNNTEMFKILVKEGRREISLAKVKRHLNIGINDDRTLTPLFFCFPCQRLATLFMEFGAQGSLLNITVCYEKYRSDLAYLDFSLAQFDMDLRAVDSEGRPALQLACEADDFKGFVLLVAHGCDVDVRCYPDGRTMLHEACLRGKVNWVKMLVD
jgi:ankyrin repeat protein